MLHFYQEITSFSCLLKACKDDIGLAEVAGLLHVVSMGSVSRLQCPSHEEMTDETHESLKDVVECVCFNCLFFRGVSLSTTGIWIPAMVRHPVQKTKPS